jgi:methyl-accepting chemotaxis protein
LKIRTKILFILAAVAIVSAGISAAIALQIAQRAIEEQSFKKLTAVRELKADQLESYFRQISDQVVSFSEDRMIIDAMKAFKQGFDRINSDLEFDENVLKESDRDLRLYYQDQFLPRLQGNREDPAYLPEFLPADDKVRLLQSLYVSDNPFETGQKHLLDSSDDPSEYSKIHGIYHPIIRNFLDRFGYYDIFLIDDETGHIVYSVFKEVDFGTSLLGGPYRDTNFALAFRDAGSANHNDFVRLVDFEPYAPSYGAPASFIASPIFEGDERIGVVVFQMPVDRINAIMTNNERWSSVGLGESGESYLVADDFTLRSEPRFLIENKDEFLETISASGVPSATIEKIAHLDSAIGLQRVKNEGTIAALAGETGLSILEDYRGVPVLSAFKPLNISDVTWAIMSEIDKAEAFAASGTLRNQVLIGLLILTAISIVVAMVFARTLTRPLTSLSRTASEIAEGNLGAEIKVGGKDEIGQLANSFNVMRKSVKEMVDRQASMIDALAVPLIPLRDDVAVMPLVGEFDDRRMNQLNETLLEEIHRMGARVAIIDVTGVSSFNEAFASGLERAVSAARLLGAEIIITGMQPDVARGLASVEQILQGVLTQRSLQNGIDLAISHLRRSAGPRLVDKG